MKTFAILRIAVTAALILLFSNCASDSNLPANPSLEKVAISVTGINSVEEGLAEIVRQGGESFVYTTAHVFPNETFTSFNIEEYAISDVYLCSARGRSNFYEAALRIPLNEIKSKGIPMNFPQGTQSSSLAFFNQPPVGWSLDSLLNTLRLQRGDRRNLQGIMVVSDTVEGDSGAMIKMALSSDQMETLVSQNWIGSSTNNGSPMLALGTLYATSPLEDGPGNGEIRLWMHTATDASIPVLLRTNGMLTVLGKPYKNCNLVPRDSGT